jgi:hypothetical protein
MLVIDDNEPYTMMYRLRTAANDSSTGGQKQGQGQEQQRVIQLGEGTILGIGVLTSKVMVPGAWIWKDELVDGEPSVGAVSPVTVTATDDRVKVGRSSSS